MALNEKLLLIKTEKEIDRLFIACLKIIFAETKSKNGQEENTLKHPYEAICSKDKLPDAVLLSCRRLLRNFWRRCNKASEILGITLTRRANGSASSVELAGFLIMHSYLPLNW